MNSFPYGVNSKSSQSAFTDVQKLPLQGLAFSQQSIWTKGVGATGDKVQHL